MKQSRSINIRMDADLYHALRVQAAQNDRSINREACSIFRKNLETKKAPGQSPNRPDASEQ